MSLRLRMRMLLRPVLAVWLVLVPAGLSQTLRNSEPPAERFQLPRYILSLPWQPGAAAIDQLEQVAFTEFRLQRQGAGNLYSRQVRVRRRRNGAPAAFVTVKARTPGIGPSATFGSSSAHEAEFRTDESGSFNLQYATSQLPGTFTIELEVDFVDPSGTHYQGSGRVPLQIRGPMAAPGIIKNIAMFGLAPAVVLVPWTLASQPNPTRIDFGDGRVGPRQ